MENALMARNGNSLTEYKDPAIVAAAEAAKARIQAAYIMAFQKPRNPDEARDVILHSCRRPAFADRVEYKKPVGNKQIKGPSIRFAEEALRSWGNIMTESQVIYDDDQVRRIKVFCTDLETNATFSKELQISKTVERRNPPKDRDILRERTNSSGDRVFIVSATEDELMTKEAALISKAVRNEGLRFIPADIIDEALDVARKTLLDRDSKDPDAAKKAVLDNFSSIGVKPRDIEKYLGHKTDGLTPAEMADLRAIYRAIRDGEARWSDYVDQDGDGGKGDGGAENREVYVAQFDLLGKQKINEQFPGVSDKAGRAFENFVVETAAGNDMAIDDFKFETVRRGIFDQVWGDFYKKYTTVPDKKKKDRQAEKAGTPEGKQAREPEFPQESLKDKDGEIILDVETKFKAFVVEMIKGTEWTMKQVEAYTGSVAAANNLLEADIKKSVINSGAAAGAFGSGFKRWAEKKNDPKTSNGQEAPEPVQGGDGPFPEETDETEDRRPDNTQINCPKEEGETRSLIFCRKFCQKNKDCGAWKA